MGALLGSAYYKTLISEWTVVNRWQAIDCLGKVILLFELGPCKTVIYL